MHLKINFKKDNRLRKLIKDYDKEETLSRSTEYSELYTTGLIRETYKYECGNEKFSVRLTSIGSLNDRTPTGFKAHQCTVVVTDKYNAISNDVLMTALVVALYGYQTEELRVDNTVIEHITDVFDYIKQTFRSLRKHRVELESGFVVFIR